MEFGVELSATHYAHSIDISAHLQHGSTIWTWPARSFNPNLIGAIRVDIPASLALGGTWDFHLREIRMVLVKQGFAGGWTISSIFVAHTGTPFTIFDSQTSNSKRCPA